MYAVDCDCRKPRPGMVRRAARALGVRPEECVVVGDIGADVAAAQAAGAREALARLRAAGVPTGMVSNQSGVARGLLSEDDVRAVNARVEQLLGAPLGPVAYCPHGPDEGCDCRKPAPGLIRRAAAELGVDPARCVVIGDIGADVEAARAAGARAILVPTPVTRAAEVAAAEEVAPDLASAVDRVLAAGPRAVVA